MKKTDLTQLSIGDLKDKLTDEKNTLSKMKFGHSISPVENPLRIRLLRKSVARMLTEIKKRSITESKSGK